MVTCPIGVVSTVAGSNVFGYMDGVGTVARFYYPYGISVDSTGNVWVADTNNNMIRKINATTGTAARLAFNIVECMLTLVCCVVS